MSANGDALELLRSIDASLKQLVAQSRQAQPKPVASDRDLDGPHGDQVIRFMPRDWTGASFKGRRMSECPPELLEMVAETLDYFAEQAEKNDERTDAGKPTAPFKRADAARARGWAKRIRDGKHIPAGPRQTWMRSPSADDEWAGGSDGF